MLSVFCLNLLLLPFGRTLPRWGMILRVVTGKLHHWAPCACCAETPPWFPWLNSLPLQVSADNGGEVPLPSRISAVDASEGKGPQRPPQKQLGRRLEEVAKAVGRGYCRLQMPLSLALGVRESVAGRRHGALEGGGGGGCPPPPPSPPQCIPGRRLFPGVLSQREAGAAKGFVAGGGRGEEGHPCALHRGGGLDRAPPHCWQVPVIRGGPRHHYLPPPPPRSAQPAAPTWPPGPLSQRGALFGVGDIAASVVPSDCAVYSESPCTELTAPCLWAPGRH